MSLRYFSVRLFRNGRQLLRLVYKRNISVNIAGKNEPGRLTPAFIKSTAPDGNRFELRNVGAQARSLLADTILSKVSCTLNNDLRRKATRRLMYGDSVPFFALVGISLASGAGVLTREDELEALCLEIRDAVSRFKWNMISINESEAVFDIEDMKLDNLSIGSPIAKGCNAIVYSARIKDSTKVNSPHGDGNLIEDFVQFPLALKMMFNYDVQSNAMSILRAMYRETIPARRCFSNDEVSQWESQFADRRVVLPPHPNIVAMYSVFTDYVPQLAGSMTLYPSALPARINPSGYGRNMSLFLLMKRYQYSLRDYLKLNDNLTIRNRVVLFAQLLEAVTHINLYGIAHRDMKSDNVLVDCVFTEKDDTVPVLVVSDFGSCLADYVNGLHIPYNTEHVEKGGNATLMAPEIATQRPGSFSFLNYTKSDLWAAGTIAYEIFGSRNPFYNDKSDANFKQLTNFTYKDSDLHELRDEVPDLMKRLVKYTLKRNPNKRLTPEVAANVCQLYLWAPSHWIKSKIMPSSTEIIQWLLCLTTKVLYEGRLPDSFNMECPVQASGSEFQVPKRSIHDAAVMMTTKSTRRTHPEYVLISSFLGRTRLTQIKQALNWIHKE